jgi:CBS domain-containing protein
LLNVYRPTGFWIDESAGREEATMTVKTILSTKGGDLISIEPTATLDTAVKTLAKHRIGALLVLGPDRRVIGILSERDIVRVLAEQGADVLAKPLAQVMTRKVVTVGPTDTVGAIMERMTTGKFRHVPVVEQEQVVGIISIGDVVKHRLHEMEQESAALRDYIQSA